MLAHSYMYMAISQTLRHTRRLGTKLLGFIVHVYRSVYQLYVFLMPRNEARSDRSFPLVTNKHAYSCSCVWCAIWENVLAHAIVLMNYVFVEIFSNRQENNLPKA